MDDDEARAAGRALSSPLRLRILRKCRFDARTNKELAEAFGMNPGTMLHHVRTLVDTGFLAPQPERSGAQGAREVPYLATGRSWDARMENAPALILETVRQQVALAAPDTVYFGWLGLRLSPSHRDELHARLNALFLEYKDLEPDADGEDYSLAVILHPEGAPAASA